MKQLRAILTLRNNQLLSRREKLGVSQEQIGQAIGVAGGTYGDYERLAADPIKGGKWKDSALKIAEYFGVHPDDLWPEQIRRIQINRVEAELDACMFAGRMIGDNTRRIMMLNSGEQVANLAALRSDLRAVIGTLTPMEQKLIEMYMDGLSTSDIAREIGVSAQRAWQIKERVARKMRHPSRCKRFEKYGYTPQGGFIWGSTTGRDQ
jgi:transcriptional regulator with XRE-family HTH domain